MPFCKHCGNVVDVNKKYCTHCGKPNIVLTIEKAFVNSTIVNISENVKIKPQNNKTALQLIFNKQALIVSAIILSLATAAYFLIFNKTHTSTMYVFAETLKLRSSTYDGSDANVLTEAKFGTPIEITNNNDLWFNAEYNGQKGFMGKKYLATPQDFFEVQGFLKNLGTLDTVTSTRFKRSILNYLHKNNYTSNLSSQVINVHFKGDVNIANKEKWQIVKQKETYTKSFIVGKFTNSSKYGIAVLLEKINEPKIKKVVLFIYDENENEIKSYSIDAGNVDYLQKIEKGEINIANGGSHLLFDGVILENSKSEENSSNLLLFNGNEIQNVKFEYEEGGY